MSKGIKRKVKKETAINWDGKDTLLIDCYRVKIEYKENGQMRLYFFNCTKKGDSCIEIEEPIYQVRVSHETEKPFFFNNPFENPSKRFNYEQRKEED